MVVEKEGEGCKRGSAVGAAKRDGWSRYRNGWAETSCDVLRAASGAAVFMSDSDCKRVDASISLLCAGPPVEVETGEKLWKLRSMSPVSSIAASFVMDADRLRSLGEMDRGSDEAGYVHKVPGLPRHREHEGFAASHLSFLDEQGRQAASTRLKADRCLFVSVAVSMLSARSFLTACSLR